MYVYGILKLDIIVSQWKKHVNYIPMKFLLAEAILYANCVHKTLDSPKLV